MVALGETAPDFIAPASVGETAQELELFRLVEDTEAVVLLFVPVDFVPPPTAELVAVAEAGWHDREDVAIVGISADSLYAHTAYADRFDLPFPLVSDWRGAVADSYGLRRQEFDTHTDVPERAVVVVDGDWRVRCVEVADPLARPSPTPVELAAETLSDLGLSVARPQVPEKL
jgi:peroxiredoxin